MTITGQPAMSLLDSVLKAETTRQDVGITVLKKAQDVGAEEATAILKLIESSAAPPQESSGLDAFA